MPSVDRTVRMRQGQVRGVVENDAVVFKGIPYAAPLDGSDRFRAPRPAVSWDGVRDASSFSASVPQPGEFGRSEAWAPGDDTECLTVNIWVPETGGSGLPVMVWLYGGKYAYGSSAIPSYDGTAYARDGVVFVSMNYRVGYEGFGWVADAPANRGLLDQIEALRWVQDNIAAFGGNPDNVTVFGHSAGAGSVVALLTTERARGLMRRAIGQSVPSMFVGESDAREVAELITDQLGAVPSTEELATVPSESLHAAQSIVVAENPPAWAENSGMLYAPVLDGDLLQQTPWAALAAGAGRDVDLICGYTSDECGPFTDQLGESTVDLPAMAEKMGLPPRIVDEYRAAFPGLTDRQLHTTLLSDAFFRIPSVWCAQAHAERGGRTYLYEFAWSSPTGKLRGAAHGVDVPTAFADTSSELAKVVLGDSVPAEFAPLSRELRNAWTSFATDGDPGWPCFESETALARVWDDPVTVRAEPIAESRRIWAEYWR